MSERRSSEGLDLLGHGLPGAQLPRPGDNWYPTPAEYSTALVDGWSRLGGPAPAQHDEGAIWEPACGDGAIALLLERLGWRVAASDLNDHGFGESGVDFLATTELRAPLVVTNPPYGDDLEQRFAEHALQLGAREVWLLCRLNWLEAGKRIAWFRRAPLEHVWIVNCRKAMWPGGKPPAGKEGSTLSYNHAWFGFLAGRRGLRQVDWVSPRLDMLNGWRPC